MKQNFLIQGDSSEQFLLVSLAFRVPIIVRNSDDVAVADQICETSPRSYGRKHYALIFAGNLSSLEQACSCLCTPLRVGEATLRILAGLSSLGVSWLLAGAAGLSFIVTVTEQWEAEPGDDGAPADTLITAFQEILERKTS